jgi:hypothetical protein
VNKYLLATLYKREKSNFIGEISGNFSAAFLWEEGRNLPKENLPPAIKCLIISRD